MRRASGARSIVARRLSRSPVRIAASSQSVKVSTQRRSAPGVAEKTARGETDRGIVVCGSGIGMSIAANKVRGVRAALCKTVEEARMTRQHNDSNVLALSEKSLDDPQLEELVRTWLETPFEGGRHKIRIDKISEYEKGSR